uniref:Ig-like domain-containing protein n=1 Tax=Xiphophorus couchianus TaxID=32473 RepID=A0A3B5MAL3_9TELE
VPVYLLGWVVCFLVCNSRIQQSLPQIVKENAQVQIQCSHEDKTRPFMLWYQQRDHGQPVVFIGYEYGTKAQIYGGQFEEQFKMKRENSLTGILTVLSANLSHSAVYFCAITDHSDVVGGLSAIFGEGTKLTVLEVKTTPKPPKVQVFPPSKKECESKTDEKKMKTLVCLASGFYPDHVTVSWQINGFNEKQGVKTDGAATMKDDGNYIIMSRLRVTASKWLKKGTNITCIVSFFDGNNTVPYPNWTIEKYLQTMQRAKLSYTALLMKSSIYGLFVLLLVWKIQVCSIQLVFVLGSVSKMCPLIIVLNEYYSLWT